MPPFLLHNAGSPRYDEVSRAARRWTCVNAVAEHATRIDSTVAFGITVRIFFTSARRDAGESVMRTQLEPWKVKVICPAVAGVTGVPAGGFATKLVNDPLYALSKHR